MEIRLLKASEIECRIGTNKDSGMSLLLYKDARVDQKILDEVYGPTNWKREHKVMGSPVIVKEKDKYNKSEKEVIKGQYFSCVVSVWDSGKKEWISKEDTGNESNTDEIKGLYSDSFKRACVNFGIGRELYTSPFIWIPASKGYDKYEKFKVVEIGYNDEREINRLVIADSKGNKCFEFGKNVKNNQAKSNANTISEDQLKHLYAIAKGKNVEVIGNILSRRKLAKFADIDKTEYNAICEEIERLGKAAQN